jgi:hypothetical protein
MREIKRADIVGARIVDIHETYEASGGLETRIYFFTVDRDVTFSIPYAGAIWTDCELPSNAVRMENEYVEKNFELKEGLFGRLRFEETAPTTVDVVKRIKQRTIVGVYCVPFDDGSDFDCPGQGILVFDDGSQASNTMVVPEGIGAGLNYCEGGSEACVPMDQLVDFFTIVR